MRMRVRSGISCLAVAWVFAVIVWAVYGSLTHRVRAENVSASRWRQAGERPAAFPIRWTPGKEVAPLLPAQGEIILRDEETVINGLALAPSTFNMERLGFAVEFVPEGFERYPKLRRPLLPLWWGAKENCIPAARAAYVCWGISDPLKAASEGLRLQWDGSLAVLRAGGEAPLFPAREARFEPGANGQHRLGVELDGNHVLAYVNDRLVLDFRTNQPLAGGVGFGTPDGVVTLKGLDIFVPE